MVALVDLFVAATGLVVLGTVLYLAAPDRFVPERLLALEVGYGWLVCFFWYVGLLFGTRACIAKGLRNIRHPLA